MIKAEWGEKRNCPKCSANFYDLKKNPAHCPKCQHSFDPEALVKKKPKRKAAGMSEAAHDKILAAAHKAKLAADGEEAALDLPEFEDLGVVEEIDDLEEVDIEEMGAVKAKPSGTADEEEEEDEVFLDETLEEGADILDHEEDVVDGAEEASDDEDDEH